MKKWKWIRALVCVLVVCCLIVNLSPIRAQAAALGTVLLASVAVGSVVGATLIGLGVLPGPDPAAFNDLVDRCVADLPSLGVSVTDGLINVVKIMTGQKVNYAVDQSFIETVRSWLFDASAAVTVTSTVVPEGYWDYGGYQAPPYRQDVDLSIYPYILMCRSASRTGSITTYFMSQPLLISATHSNYYPGYQLYSDVDIDYVSFTRDATLATGWATGTTGTFTGGGNVLSVAYASANLRPLWANFDICGTVDYNYGEVVIAGSEPIGESFTTVTVADGLVAGSIATSDTDILTGYDVWAGNATTVPGSDIGQDDKETVLAYPLPLGGTYEETIDATQEEVWEGETVVDDSTTGSDTVTGDKISDMDTTNFWGWLGNILSSQLGALRDGLLDGISSLFVPTAAEMEGIKDQWDTLLHDRFGVVYDAIVLVDEWAHTFRYKEPVTQLHFPEATIPLLDGEVFVFGGWDVDVVPEGFPFLIEAVKKLISIICTLAFLNGMKNRYERFLGGRV